MLFKKLSKEVFLELAQIFLICIGGFLCLLLIGKMLKLRQLLFTLDLSLLDLIKLFIYLSPFFLMVLLPVACMFSMFLTFQRMSADRELMALRAGGVSVGQILPAPLFFLILALFFNVFVSFWGISWGTLNFQEKVLNLAKSKARLSIQAGMFNTEFSGLTVYADRVEKPSGTLKGVFLSDKGSMGMAVNIVAPEGRILSDQKNSRLLFQLENGSIYRKQGNELSRIRFKEYEMALDLGKMLGDVDLNRGEPEALSWQVLNNNLTKGGMSKEKLYELKVEKQKRLALPVACVILGFFALLLGWIFEGVRRHYGALLILGMFFVYYAIFSAGLSLGETARLDPFWGVWLANAVFALLGIYLFRIALKEVKFA